MLFSRAVLTGALAFTVIVWAAPQKPTTGQSDAAGQTSKKASKKTKTAPATAVDLNTASEKDLEAIPGIGPATAKKIVDHRPYQSVDDLAKAGIGRKEIDSVRSMVTVSNAPVAAATPSGQQSPNRAQTGAANRSAVPSVAPNPPPAGSGMVWVNTETKVYHREGDRWYGKTKHGSYMSEADAIKAGYRAAKNK
jgi:Helix-hairpin-helix motif